VRGRKRLEHQKAEEAKKNLPELKPFDQKAGNKKPNKAEEFENYMK